MPKVAFMWLLKMAKTMILPLFSIPHVIIHVQRYEKISKLHHFLDIFFRFASLTNLSTEFILTK